MDIKHQSYMSLMGCCNNSSHVALYNSTGYQDIVQGSAVYAGQVCTTSDLIHCSNHTLTWPRLLSRESPAGGHDWKETSVGMGSDTRLHTVLCRSLTGCKLKFMIPVVSTKPTMHHCSAQCLHA